MSQATTLTLLPQTTYVNPGDGSTYTVTGNSQPAAAYYLGNRDLQTVSMSLTSCTGNIIVEASLATSPGAGDWFEVHAVTANSTTETSYTNINGNFVHMRAKITDFHGGIVNFVKLSY